jgi:hypothetical protein
MYNSAAQAQAISMTCDPALARAKYKAGALRMQEKLNDQQESDPVE